jgi:hypothetical protein
MCLVTQESKEQIGRHGADEWMKDRQTVTRRDKGRGHLTFMRSKENLHGN